jgi:tRNA threonylcarbamoyladenosine biosynthesis protein TsaE
MHYYAGRWPVLHADLYRLDGPTPAHAVGLDEELDAGEAVVFVEWPDRLQDTPAARTFEVHLEITPGDRRKVWLRERDRDRG